jgi:Fe-S-cluster containining protein
MSPSPHQTTTGELDCLECGACCHQRPGTILVIDEDLEHWKAIGRADIIATLEPGHFGCLAFPMSPEGACTYHGTKEQLHACRIYEERATVCRAFDKGSAQCREFRRDRGLEPPRETDRERGSPER